MPVGECNMDFFPYLCGVDNGPRILWRQLAIIKMFLLVSIPTDIYDNRRHIHVFRKGGRRLRSVAKIWIERNGEKCIEIVESDLSPKDNQMIVDAIDRHWEFINEQITLTFKGQKTKVKNIEK